MTSTGENGIPPDRIVGIKPALPWPLCYWPWLTAPIRAERLAALRIGLSLCLLIDILFTYLPDAGLWFTAKGVGGSELFGWLTKEGSGRWTLFPLHPDAGTAEALMLLWALTTLTLLLGFLTRISAILCWALAVSVANVNSYIDNAGDLVRNLLLFYLMLCPCGAVWSIDRWYLRRWQWLRRRPEVDRQPLYVYPWAARLIFVQMTIIYFFNGLYKISGLDWAKGHSLYYVLGDLTLTRVSFTQFPVPVWMSSALTHMVLYWELFFPALVIIPWQGIAELMERSRWSWVRSGSALFRWNLTIILLFGVSFHIGIGASMELGGFAFYMLCCYLPLVPWEGIAKKPDDPYQNGIPTVSPVEAFEEPVEIEEADAPPITEKSRG